MVTFSCSQCDKKLKVADGKAGTRVKCPGCGATIVVPADANGAAAKPAPTKAGAAADAGQKTRPDGPRREKEEKKPSQMGLWLGVGGGGAALCLVAVLAFLMLRGDKEKPAAAASKPPAPVVEVKPEKVEDTAPVVPAAVTRMITPAKDDTKKKDEEALKILTVTKAKPETGDIIRHVLKSSAFVVSTSDKFIGFGTGFVVDRKNKLLLTNYHLVANAAKTAVFFPTYKNGQPLSSKTDYFSDIAKLEDRNINWGKLIGRDERRDLALLELAKIPPEVRAIPFASASPRAGDVVHSIGNAGASGALWVYTPGTVRSVYHSKWAVGDPKLNLAFEVDAEIVETNSALNPGDSGGPLVNDQGELVGIAEGGARDAQLVSFFVDLTEMVKFVQATCKTRNLAWVRDGQPLRASVKVDVPDLIRYLDHPNDRVRSKAVELLGEMGPRAQLAIPAMMKTLNDKDDVIRKLAAKALENLGPPDKADLGVLKNSLQDKNELVRAYAAGALGKLGGEARAAVPELIKALQDPLPLVRQNAAQSLGKVGAQAKEKVLPALDKLLKDEEKDVRVAAADAMYHLMSPLTAADLTRVNDDFLKHKDLEIRTVGARALGQLSAEAGKSLPLLMELCKSGTDKALRLAALGSVAQFGPAAKPAVEILIEALKDRDPEIRQAACVALGKIGPDAKAAVLALATALRETDPIGRESVIVALGEIGPEAANTATELGKLLRDEKDREIRIRIVTTLGKFGSGAKVAARDMIQAFADKKIDEELTKVAQMQNSQMHNMPGQPPMQPGGAPPMQNDPNRRADVQKALSFILGKVDKGFQEKNAEALSKIGRAAVPALMSGLRSNSTLVRWGCIKAVGMVGPPAKEAAAQLVFNARFEQITEIKDDAVSAGQKITATR